MYSIQHWLCQIDQTKYMHLLLALEDFLSSMRSAVRLCRDTRRGGWAAEYVHQVQGFQSMNWVHLRMERILIVVSLISTTSTWNQVLLGQHPLGPITYLMKECSSFEHQIIISTHKYAMALCILSWARALLMRNEDKASLRFLQSPHLYQVTLIKFCWKLSSPSGITWYALQ